VGEQLTLVNDDLEGVGVVEVTRIEFTTFGAVPRSFALAESEGDASIEEWRAGHRRFWEGDGLAVTDEAGQRGDTRPHEQHEVIPDSLIFDWTTYGVQLGGGRDDCNF